MSSIKNQNAVITGASSGIGETIALDLAAKGVNLFLLGRNIKALQTVAGKVDQLTSQIHRCQIDLTQDAEIKNMSDYIRKIFGHIDILIHSAGVISLGKLESAPVEDFDWQYKTNVRAPYFLTQALLPLLRLSGFAQVVFINSSAGVTASANVGQYAATKHALRAVADSFRREVNPEGIRVISIFPGRTASPMQEKIFRMEGRIYQPEVLLQPQDVAAVVINSLCLPSSAEVTDINIRPMCKSN